MDFHAIAAAAIERGALQKAPELAGLLADVAALAPAVIVEIGSDSGGTLYAWSQACPDADVITVTLQSGPFSTGRPLVAHGAAVIEGDSHEASTLTALSQVLADRPIDVLFIDGDHTYLGVRLDFEMYAPLVRSGGLVVLHDICHHPDRPDVGVERLWLELKGDKREHVAPPAVWGGIGVLRR